MTNSVTIVGNTTREPELKFSAAGKPVAKFGIAVNTRRKDGNDWVDGDPEFYDVTAFGHLAEMVAEHVGKGVRTMVSGRLNFSSWENDAGEKRSKVGLIADDVAESFMFGRGEARTKSGGAKGQAQEAADSGLEPF